MKLICAITIVLTCILLNLSIIGCASISTEGTLSPITNYSNIAQNKKSITIRVYKWTDYLNSKDKVERINIFHSPQLTDKIVEILKSSGAFPIITPYYFSSDTINIDAHNTIFIDSLITQAIKDTKTDYFIDLIIWNESRKNEFHWRYFLIPVTIATIGLIPYYSPKNIKITAKIYQHNGEIIKTFSSENHATILYWTPFIFYSESTLFADAKETVDLNITHTVQNLLEQIFKSGVLQ